METKNNSMLHFILCHQNVGNMHHKVTNEGVPLLFSSFLRFAKLKLKNMEKSTFPLQATGKLLTVLLTQVATQTVCSYTAVVGMLFPEI